MSCFILQEVEVVEEEEEKEEQEEEEDEDGKSIVRTHALTRSQGSIRPHVRKRKLFHECEI